MDFNGRNLKDIESLAYKNYHTAGRDVTKWREVRDALEYVFSKVEDTYHKAYLANTLGYIYYYGRTNDFVPQYEEAYKYFSIGAEAGIYESIYKIGDMYKNGYYVEKDYVKAVDLYFSVYDSLYEEFLDEEFDGPYADIALRVGDIYKPAKEFESESEKALLLFTMADYAIRKRMDKTDFFGNYKVFDAIEISLKELQSELHVDTTQKEIREDYPSAFPLAFADDHKALVTFETEGDSVIIKARRIPGTDERRRRIALIFPEAGFVDFSDEVIECAKGNARLELFKSGDSFLCDSFEYDASENAYVFMAGDTKVASISAKEYVFELKR